MGGSTFFAPHTISCPTQIPNKWQHARPHHSTYQIQICMSMSGELMVGGPTYSNGHSDDTRNVKKMTDHYSR